MQDPLRDAQRRMQRAWSADGLAEIATGLLCLLPALLEWAKMGLERRTPQWQTLNFIQMLVIFPGVWLVMWGLPRLRNRLLGSREGIMVPRLAPEGARKAAGIGAVAAMTAIVAAAFLTRLNWVPIAILVAGGVAALLFVEVGRMAGIRRYFLMGAAVALASILVALRFPDFETAFAWQFGFIGTLSMATGIVTLRKFLAQPQHS